MRKDFAAMWDGAHSFGSLVALFWGSEQDGHRSILRLTKSANRAGSAATALASGRAFRVR
jgi:hypothetical protein